MLKITKQSMKNKIGIFLIIFISVVAIAYKANGYTVSGGKNLGASVLRVVSGGTGASSFTVGECLYGNGTDAIYSGACSAGSMTALPEGQIYVGNATNQATATSSVTVDSTGLLTASGGTSLEWTTAYGWGDHLGLYLPIGGGVVTGSTTINGDLTVTGDITGYIIGTNLQAWDAQLDSLAGLTPGAEGQMITSNGLGGYQITSPANVKQYLSLNNVENTALSTWAGSSNITTLGTIGTGVWQGTAIGDTYISSASNWNTAYGWGDWNGNIDISTDTNLGVSGTLLDLTGDTLSINEGTLTDTKICTYESGTGIECNTTDQNTTYTGGTNLTLSGTTFNVDDAFLLNNGDVGTGNYDFGGATFFEIPNGTNPTANDPGEIAHDTTDNQLIIDDYIIRTAELIGSVTIASTSDFFKNIDLPIPPEKDGYTVTRLACYVTNGTSVVVTMTDGTNAMDSLTCGTSITADDGSIANSTVTANELMKLDPGTVTGSVDFVSFSWYGIYTRE